jgi:hypothetical protein
MEDVRWLCIEGEWREVQKGAVIFPVVSRQKDGTRWVRVIGCSSCQRWTRHLSPWDVRTTTRYASHTTLCEHKWEPAEFKEALINSEPRREGTPILLQFREEVILLSKPTEKEESPPRNQ